MWTPNTMLNAKLIVVQFNLNDIRQVKGLIVSTQLFVSVVPEDDTVPVKDFFEWFLNIAHSKKVVSYQRAVLRCYFVR